MKNLKCSGIYVIENIINNKKYIGSSKNIHKRIKKHFELLKRNKHHSLYLQNSYNKHGKSNFKYYLLEDCLTENLLKTEQKHLDNIKNWKNSFNMSKIAKGNSFDLSTHPNEIEIRKKISEASKGRGSKPFIIDNNKYKTLKDAANEFNVDIKTISYKIKNWKYKNYYYENKPKEGEFINNKYGCYWYKPKINKEKKINYCVCGNKITYKAINCRKCAGIKYAHTKKIIINGIIYDSISIAAKDLNISKPLLFYRLKSNTIQFKKYQYVN